MGARGVLGRGDAPVVWWALEGAPLLEHVEVVKLRKTPSLVFVGIFSSCDGGLEWQRGWFCFESVPLGKQGYRLRLTKVRFGGRQTTAKISASTRSFSQNTWGHRADTPKVYLMFRLGQLLLYGTGEAQIRETGCTDWPRAGQTPAQAPQTKKSTGGYRG